jgi:hypothetical protein
VTLVTCRTSMCEEILWRVGNYTIPIELDQRKRSDVVRIYWGVPGVKYTFPFIHTMAQNGRDTAIREGVPRLSQSTSRESI